MVMLLLQLFFTMALQDFFPDKINKIVTQETKAGIFPVNIDLSIVKSGNKGKDKRGGSTPPMDPIPHRRLPGLLCVAQAGHHRLQPADHDDPRLRGAPPRRGRGVDRAPG